MKKYCGLVLVDKSPGFTSHHVVAYFRKLLKQSNNCEIKVGHLGTLDPFASGLLPILIGGVTRLTDEMMDGKKQYLFQIKFGEETDTLDIAGNVVKKAIIPENIDEKLARILSQFIGEIEQIPPVYSAIKMQGRPLYEYMRAQGRLPFEIESKKRKILIEKLEIVSSDLPNHLVTLRVLCGKGTYIRSLARDLAYAVGSVAHCYSLRREYVEPWRVENALLFSEKLKPNLQEIDNKIVPPQDLLPDIPFIKIPQTAEKLFCAGNIVTLVRSDVLNYKFDANKNIRSPSVENLCFTSAQDGHILYLSELENIDELHIKIKPKKKII